MTNQRELETILSRIKEPYRRIATLGALLARESELGTRLMVVGGSAISVYTKGEYVSSDVDLIGDRERIIPVLKRWGFRQEGKYWIRPDLGLLLDVNRPTYKSQSSLTRVIKTRYGPIRFSAIEDLIVRRLLYAHRPSTKPGPAREYLIQAARLVIRFSDVLDWDYIRSEARYEGLQRVYRELQALLRPLSVAAPSL